jgi:uncharacterized protein YfdQ (DUF2303 family)
MNPQQPTSIHAPQNSEARAGADLVKELVAPTLFKIEHPEDPNDAIEFFARQSNSGILVHSLRGLQDEHRTKPARRQGTAELKALESFIAHVNRFKDADSAIFAEPEQRAAKLTAVLDYHRAGAKGEPRFGGHLATYSFPLSDEWLAWTKTEGRTFSQTEFAQFIEDRIADAANPKDANEGTRSLVEKLGAELATPNKLLELSRGLSVRVDQRVVNAKTLQTGEGQIQFSETHQDEQGAPLKVPGAFLLSIPVFKLGALYQVPVRLRYRVKDQAVAWSFALYRTDLLFQHAFQTACDVAKTETACPLFVGSPE